MVRIDALQQGGNRGGRGVDPRALASMEEQEVTHTDEIERRMAEIRKDPILSRRMDELRRGVTERATVAQRLDRMRRDRIEEIASERDRTGGFRKSIGVL